MSKYVHTILLIAGLAGLTAAAQSPMPVIKVAAIRQTSPVSGPEMYKSYCASCHGANATGNGPAASALKAPPTDLSLLSQKNGGAFPKDHVMAVLKLGVANPAHGSTEMPVWGDLFSGLSPSVTDPSSLVNLRIINLTHYLEKLQK